MRVFRESISRMHFVRNNRLAGAVKLAGWLADGRRWEKLAGGTIILCEIIPGRSDNNNGGLE